MSNNRRKRERNAKSIRRDDQCYGDQPLNRARHCEGRKQGCDREHENGADGQGCMRYAPGVHHAFRKGFEFCKSERRPCWLYAVDDIVVWQADEARRIGSEEALHRNSTKP